MTARHKLTTTERGYGWRHQQERERAKRAMESNGGAICWRCGKLITVDMQWDLGHDDVARDVVPGPEHRRLQSRHHRAPRQTATPANTPHALAFFD